MKTIKGDLILEKDTTFKESIKVEGNIRGKDDEKFNLTVYGNIDALDIHARNIDALDIHAWNIHARNIDAWDIDARNIDAWDIHARNIHARNIDALDIICVSRKKKSKKAKTIAYSITLDRYSRKRKEVMPEKPDEEAKEE